MTQDERWMTKYNEVVEFIESNHRNPSKYRIEEQRTGGGRVPVSRIKGVSNNQ